MPPKPKQGFSHWTSPEHPHCIFTVPWSVSARPWDDFDCAIRLQKGVPLQIVRLVVGNMLTLQAKTRPKLVAQVVSVRISDDGRRATALMSIVPS